MTQDEMKQEVAHAAVEFVKEGDIIGVGTGSTVNYFIDALAPVADDIQGAVSSSEASSKRLKSLGIEVFDLNSVSSYDIYVDGADEVTTHKHMIKGGGAALTREKIVAAVAKTFVCIVDQSKIVDVLGKFPLPVEVIPMARSYVARQILALGGDPVYRQGVITDNGNHIIDVHNLSIVNPVELESQLNQITGVVCNGIFANRGADIVLSAGNKGLTRW